MEQSPSVLSVKNRKTLEHPSPKKPRGNLCSVLGRMRRVQRDVCTHKLPAPAPGTGLGIWPRAGRSQPGVGSTLVPEGGGLHSAARKCLWLMSNSGEGDGSSRFWHGDLVSL